MNPIEQQKPEIPIITIERDEEPQAQEQMRPKASQMSSGQSSSWRSNWLRWIAIAFLAALIVIGAYIAFSTYVYYSPPNVSYAELPEQTIDNLQQVKKKVKPQVVMSIDSVLDVPFRLYAIHGLKASLEMEEPDTNDVSVYLYCRSVDYTTTGRILGSLVINGKEIESDQSRMGYVAMVGDNFEIGINRSEKVKDYVIEKGGSFFRQFMLVSNGEIAPKFYLRGKWERCALARMEDGTIYYIMTENKESMWDFADALREYGVIDAIYITGGNDYSFYRTADGVRHDISDISLYPHHGMKGVVPWLVFRKIHTHRHHRKQKQ